LSEDVNLKAWSIIIILPVVPRKNKELLNSECENQSGVFPVNLEKVKKRTIKWQCLPLQIISANG
jgi:hypothetical protein